MTYRYIYNIICTQGSLAGHYYIGQHTTTNLFDGYKGSGRKLCDYYKKHPNGYTKRIIEFCATADELNEREAYWIGDRYETDDMCLNLRAGGNVIGFSAETRAKISESSKGKHKHYTEESKAKISAAHKGMHHTEETRRKISEAHKGKKSALGYKHTEEARRKISEARKGNKAALGHKHTEEARRKMSEALKGMHPSGEVKAKMSAAHKGRSWYNNGSQNVIAYECPEGFVSGRLKIKNIA